MDYKEEVNETPENEEIYEEVSHQTAPAVNGRYILFRCGLSLSLMAFAILAAQVIFVLIIPLLLPDSAEAGWFNIVLTILTIVGVGLPIFAGMMKKIPDSEIGEKGKLSFGKFIAYFIMCVAAGYIANIIGLIINAIIEFNRGFQLINPLEDFMRSSNMVLFSIYAVVIAPIVEELIFRKILLNKLRRFGDLPAILLTGFAFGLFHFNLSQFFYATVLGFFFAYITIRTNRIIYSIMLHMIMNLIGTAFVPFVMSDQGPSVLGAMSIWVFGAMTFGSIIFILNIKNITLNKPNERLLRKRDYILNPGVLLFLAIGIGMIIFNILAPIS